MINCTKLKILVFLIITVFTTIQQKANCQADGVRIWEEPLVLPTYQVDPPDKNPMFFEHDSYQGASRVLYPYPLEDDITNKKSDKSYNAVYLENEYIKLCVLPEIGGRLFYATDKTNNYEIFYRQHVVKPAHIGMLGAWISGGIEFCVFHHHRATTNMPVDYSLQENPDGSATLWIGETELRHRMKWTFGITLYPGKSYIELDGRMINATENVNSILYWANVATHVNDNYQVIFPPSTNVATFHAKNSFAHWPVTKEAFRGNSYYENNIDASWWKNHPGANSLFAHDIKEGFLAGYDHGQKAGTMLVGNPHIVKGAKLWEWGRNSIWDTKVLTDNDGPYAEVMSGAYSDNQPDYSWIKPYETKTFKQYWYPMRESKGASTANLSGLLTINLETETDILIAANTTSKHENTRLVLTEKDKVIFEKRIDISPAKPFNEIIKINKKVNEFNLNLTLFDSDNSVILTYAPIEIDRDNPLPEEVKPPLKPTEIESVEELYLSGLRLRQFHNARINPLDYFEEALRRDPLDTRSNTQMGIVHKEKGDFAKAKKYFRQALFRLTKNYTRPRECEAFYHLGAILQAEGKYEEAYDTLYRAAWDHDFAAAAYFKLAQISNHQKNQDQALVELDRSLSINASNINALNLKSSISRHKGDLEEADEIVQNILSKDMLNFWAHNELRLLKNNRLYTDKLQKLMRDNPESYLELAVAYLNTGFIDEANDILSIATKSTNKTLSQYPTIHYYLGHIDDLLEDETAATAHFKNASLLSTDYCFPFRMETINIYNTALKYDTKDAKAHYYLGNILYDKQASKAITHWENAIKADKTMAIAYRNLGWGYNQTMKDLDQAIIYYEKAIEHDNQQARFYYELDKLYEERSTPIEKRYALLNSNHKVVAQHNSPLVREAEVAIAVGEYDQAIDILTTNYFNRREGRNNLHGIYVDAMLLRGLKYMQEKNWAKALQDFKDADLYPENQSIQRDEKSQRRAQIFYLQGVAQNKLGNKDIAKEYFQKSVNIEVKRPEYNYHKSLALASIGEIPESIKLIKLMKETGTEMLAKAGEVDFFSKFGGRENENQRKASANYLLGLAQYSHDNKSKARDYFNEALSFNPGHAWARYMLTELND